MFRTGTIAEIALFAWKCDESAHWHDERLETLRQDARHGLFSGMASTFSLFQPLLLMPWFLVSLPWLLV